MIGLAVGLSWAFVSGLPMAGADPFNPITLLDWAATLSFSAALAMLAPAAWLIAELAGRAKPVVASATLMAVGGLVAAAANFIEDGLGFKSFGQVFAIGLFGVLAGPVGLAITLALRRRFLLAALAVATFAGMFSSGQAGGGFLILAAWLVLAVVLRRG